MVSLLRSRHKTLNTQILLWTLYLLFLMCEFLPVIFFSPSLPPFSSFRVSTWFSLSGRFSYHLAYISIPFPYYALSQDSVYLIHYEPLWIECVPQNSYINILTPNMIVLGGGALRRWLDGKGEGLREWG